jgi:hypothetical protein
MILLLAKEAVVLQVKSLARVTGLTHLSNILHPLLICFCLKSGPTAPEVKINAPYEQLPQVQRHNRLFRELHYRLVVALKQPLHRALNYPVRLPQPISAANA